MPIGAGGGGVLAHSPELRCLVLHPGSASTDLTLKRCPPRLVSCVTYSVVRGVRCWAGASLAKPYSRVLILEKRT